MAKRKPSHRTAVMAESWFGVTHSLPARGSKAYASMIRAYSKSHKVRKNPVKTAAGRTLHPENCPIPLSASILDARRDAKRFNELPKSKRPKDHGFKLNKRGDAVIPARFSNCDYRSAAYTMHMKPEAAGSSFKGRMAEGTDPEAQWWTRSKKEDGSLVDLSYWARGGTGMIGGFDFKSVMSRLLGNWWPTAGK